MPEFSNSMTLKEGDFVELDYTGKADGRVFDTTRKDVAKANNLPGEPHTAIICLGQNMILKGIDEGLIGKELGKHTLTLPPEKAFGKKDAKAIQMIPQGKFKEQKLEPKVGLQLNIDGMVGVIRSVSGGRVLVDFNHPLANKEVVYEVDVKKIISNAKTKVEALNKALGLEAEVQEKDKKIIIRPKNDIPKEIAEQLTTKYKDIASVDVTFTAPTQK